MGGKALAYSLANLPVTNDELEDVEPYLTATRSELLFSRGVIFVEGDAEEALMPAFADAMGYSLDRLGITVCNVAGVNFTPYVKLAASLGLPFAAVTDWDPLDGTNPACCVWYRRQRPQLHRHRPQLCANPSEKPSVISLTMVSGTLSASAGRRAAMR